MKLAISLAILFTMVGGCVGVMRDRTRIVKGPAHVTVGSVSTPWGINTPGFSVDIEGGGAFISSGKDADLESMGQLMRDLSGSSDTEDIDVTDAD